MKILHIINSLATGGAEKLIAETLPLYDKVGITSDLLLLNGTAQPFLKELEDKKCCQVFSLGKSSVYHPKHILGIMPFLKKYDIVHVHLFPAQYYVVISKILSGAKVKLIFTEHSSSNRRFRNNKFKLLDKFIYSRYHKIIAITNIVKQKVIQHTGLSENRIITIENGISLQTINTASSYNYNQITPALEQSDVLILQVSSFQNPKDQATVIRSMSHLPVHFKLILVGGGTLKENAVALVEKLQLNHRVIFLGVRNDIPRLLKTCNIVVLSSKYEGLSLSSIEGMASEKPFVASNVSGLREIVQGAGILFPQGDERKLAEIFLHLMNNPAYYDQIVQQCKRRAAEFDIEKMVAKHIDLYHQIMHR